jgi:hypothetical protein
MALLSLLYSYVDAQKQTAKAIAVIRLIIKIEPIARYLLISNVSKKLCFIDINKVTMKTIIAAITI